MKKYAKIGLALLTVLAILTCGGCSKDTSGTKEKVVLNEVAHSIFYAPLYVAIEEGYFEDEGIDLDLVTGYGADKTMTAVLSGEADIGFMGPESTLYTYLGDAGDYVINFAQLTQRAGNFLVAREQMPDFKWTDLKGKNVIGGRKGGMPQMVFEYILKKHNLDPAVDVNIDQSIDFGSTAAAFANGQGDYTIEFEPFATTLESESAGYVVASLGEESGYVPYTTFSAKQSYLDENPQIVQSFVNALKKGVDYVNSKPAADVADAIKKQFPETDSKAITKIVERYQAQESWKDDLVLEEDSFTLLQNILEEAGELSERVPYEKLVTTDFVK